MSAKNIFILYLHYIFGEYVEKEKETSKIPQREIHSLTLHLYQKLKHLFFHEKFSNLISSSKVLFSVRDPGVLIATYSRLFINGSILFYHDFWWKLLVCTRLTKRVYISEKKHLPGRFLQ